MTSRIHDICAALVIAITCGVIAGCDDSAPEQFSPPGLEIITPRVGAHPSGQAAVLLRTQQLARIAVYFEEGCIGTGRSGRYVSSIRFDVPEALSGGSTVDVTVVAVSDGGMTESRDVTLVGLGSLVSQDAPAAFLDVAAVGDSAVLAADYRLYVTRTSDTQPAETSVTGRVQAIAADPYSAGVAVAGVNAAMKTYSVSLGRLTLSDEFEFGGYDGTQPVAEIKALHVNGDLIAAATLRGMSIMDRISPAPRLEENCRTRSAETTKLAHANYDQTMYAIVVGHTERVVAAGEYLNVYEAYNADDDGSCEDPMSNRGTSVVAAPEDETAAWGAVAMALTDTYMWVGRRSEGVLRLPITFTLIGGNRYFRDEDMYRIDSTQLPHPVVVDLAPATGDRVWVAVIDSDATMGGLSYISDEGPTLWVDGATLGGVPVAVDASPDTGNVWVITDTQVTGFTEP